MRVFLLFIYTICVSTVSFNALAQKTLIYCGNLIDGESDKIKSEMTIVIEGDKISYVGNGYMAAEAQDTIIDLKDKTVLPGLFDTHVHIESQGSEKSYLNRFILNEADVAYDAAVYAKRTVKAGFTSVRDLGGSGVNNALRDAINAGKVVGPRIYSCGKSIATTGGHADPTNGYKKILMGNPGPEEGVINSADEARKAVRHQYKTGADVIKITATAGVLSMAKDGKGPQFTMEELNAIVETASEYGMVTAAHAHGAEGMKRAVEAGINSIEHGSFMTDEIMNLMIEKGTWYVPTLMAGAHVAEKAEIEGYYPAMVVPKAKEIGPQIAATFAKANKAGVNIAFGTDAGVFPHGENAKEFKLMVDAGMTPMQAIKSATISAAKLLRVEKNFGSIVKGKYADIIAVEGNPLKNITTLQSVKFVMIGGIVLN